ncbi:MAG: SDR family NAD(P)-dependent oxidoreductase [Nitrospinota bacterium]
MGKLDNRVALITGGNTGIGRATALAFHREGARVVVGYLAKKAQADGLVRTIEREGGAALAVRCDVREAAQVRRLVAAAERRFGRVEILMNNAGILRVLPFLRITRAVWEDHIATHLTGTFLCCQAVLPRMLRRRSGKIINVASQLGQVGREDFVHYSAVKGAILAFTRALAKEVGPRGVFVNAIAPGLIDTGFDPMSPRAKRAFAAELPARRLGQPEDVAATAVFLASDDSSFYMGQTLGPNGGEVMF